MANLAQALTAAFDHRAAGRPAEAAILCGRILDAVPDCAEALLLLGVLRGEGGAPAAARACLMRAVALRPDAPVFAANLGHALRAGGRAAAAESAYRRAMALDPADADAAAHRAGGLRTLGRMPDAAAYAARALVLQPDHADALVNRADALAAGGRAEEALTASDRAERVRPGDAAAAMARGVALARLDRPADAAGALAEAVRRAPERPEGWENLGVALAKTGDADGAADAFARSERIGPTPAHASLRAQALVVLGRPAEAVAAYDDALAARPDDLGLRWNRAFARLLAGDYREGWADFEVRRLDPGAEPPWRRFPVPSWGGEPPEGRTILLHAEQGYGDTLQFLRFVPAVAARGGRVVLEVQPALAALARTVAGVSAVVGRGEPLPPFDLECPLMSVPRALGTTLDDLPAAVPYVHADPARTAAWRMRIGTGEGPAVGLVWAGNPRFAGDRLRSPRLPALRPLLAVPGVRFVALQVGPGRSDLDGERLADRLFDAGAGLGDFADTAAVMGALDLVVSSCTATAHLAGALGLPTWVVLPAAPDWRWMVGRSDSPWYPTARLYRQSRVGDWETVAGRVAADLQALATRMRTDDGR